MCSVIDISNFKILDAESSEQRSLLLCPKSQTFPAFDAFLCVRGEWWPLQIMANSSKKLNAKLLVEFFNAHPHIQRRWVGIVRPSMAFEKKRFPMEVRKHNKEEEKMRETLEQYVIPFPLHDEDMSRFSSIDREVLVKMRISAFQHFVHCSRTTTAGSDDPTSWMRTLIGGKD